MKYKRQPNFKFDTWQCWKCKHIITDVEMQALRFDIGCPHCKMPFAYFSLRPGNEK